MNRRTFLSLPLALALMSIHRQAQSKFVTNSDLEFKLFRLINDYRRSQNRPSIPWSWSLSFVARQHAEDLAWRLKRPSHGWSDCPHDGARETAHCVWDAPKRLGTPYPGRAYENVFWTSKHQGVDPEEALRAWQNSHAHNATILNQGVWAEKRWAAMGVGIEAGYATVWFGDMTDRSPESR